MKVSVARIQLFFFWVFFCKSHHRGSSSVSPGFFIILFAINERKIAVFGSKSNQQINVTIIMEYKRRR